MIALGFYSVCLKASDLARTVRFYRDLGFEPTGEDAPGLRVSLKNGADTLTFMSFLQVNIINFRGAHIYRLMSLLDEAGLEPVGFNEHPDEQPLMLDDEGNPLPENECGHFTVVDPDGHELFFNTHPPEREPFELATRTPSRKERDPIGDGLLLGRCVYRLSTTNLELSRSFYTTLGLEVIPNQDSAWVVPPASHGDVGFVFQLRQSTESSVGLSFFQDEIEESSLIANGFKQRDEGWFNVDPDGRVLEVLPASELIAE